MDTGSMGLDRVGVKCGRYRALHDSDVWRGTYPIFPKVATVLGGRNQSNRLHYLLEQASQVTGYESRGPKFLFAKEKDLREHGPLSRVWWWSRLYGEPELLNFFED